MTDEKALRNGLNPMEIVVTPRGDILYGGLDLREALGLSGGPEKGLSQNVSCVNVFDCRALNVQCDHERDMQLVVNGGFCTSP